jgi:hypothetical protein
VTDDDAFEAEGEIEIYEGDVELDHVNGEDEPERGTLLIFETALSASQKGIRGCRNHKARLIESLVNRHASAKEVETGLKHVWKGHAGGTVQLSSGRDGFMGTGGRWCRITVNVKCIVHLRRE